jgi:hypothetical protein
MIDREPPHRMPLVGVPVVAGFGAYLAFIALGLFFQIQRRWIAAIAPRSWCSARRCGRRGCSTSWPGFSARSETIAGIQREFPELVGDSSRRTEPERIPPTAASAAAAEFARTYDATLAGLIPPRPRRRRRATTTPHSKRSAAR